MRYARGFIPTALVVVAATATGIACSTAGDENDGATQSALKPGGNNPPGNNGTVKIQEAGQPDEIPDNDPHVGCIFNIEFRGYDQGNLNATWSLDGHPPSAPKDTPLTGGTLAIGGDAAGGANDLDGLVTVDLSQVDLSGLTEHPQQGYHLKLTVHADGSKGSDVKHKVFWVKGCTPPPPPPPPPQDGGPPPPPPPPPPPVCGDGHLDTGEDCDDGIDNGTWGSTCTADCHYCPPKSDGGQSW